MTSAKLIRFFIPAWLLMLTAVVPASAQSLKIEVTIHPATAAGQQDGSVDITVTGGNADFTYYLYSALPWEGGKEISKSNLTAAYNYSFDKLASGTYVVMVKDREGNGAFEKITVDVQPALGLNNPVIDRSGIIPAGTIARYNFSRQYSTRGYGEVLTFITSGNPDICERI